ncbi:HAMP domain-containing histidine kinase [Vibrio brasiliensis]|uniref:sensor histidine kinase n=1 Tax=Vibrio brasiliensis TaxID=170652 RepID=UPI001EFCF0C8|nr:HAMP domain-containing sensor histidine kinase [Vibrio brasiliensis]MCG9751798.1 HAMP domain-containing histidine kinase [Vibrio brasiliensis]MCG9781370.1 HAMP domain-containing histidine kinase [Vibrio brasiliensis]
MKIKTIPMSMFKCLYLESLLGMVITFVAFIHITSEYVREGDTINFFDSANVHLQNYLDSKHQLNGLYRRLNQATELSFYDYKLQLIDSDADISQSCADCQMFSRHQGNTIYINADDRFSIALPIPNSSKLLLFSEIEDPVASTTPWYDDRDNHFFLMLFITMSLALAALLYLPLYRVNKRINRLLKVQEAFGEGELSIRAESYHISPIKEIAQSFNFMAQDIENRVKESQIFSQAIPHEIRTPLSRIQLASDLLRLNETKNREALHDSIDCYIEDISSLTSDIIQLSRLNNKRCNSKETISGEIVLRELCENRIEMMTGDASVSFNVDSNLSSLQPFGPCCYAKLALDNVLKNASYYGQGVIEVSLNEFDCCWTIDVEDNGNGIPEDKREEVFLAFSRLDKSRNLNTGGFGLGLAIASQAAKNLCWRIAVDDSHLGGARFTIVIPKPGQ